jgi:signal transduction histidine kinase
MRLGLDAPADAIGRTAAELWDPVTAEKILNEEAWLRGSDTPQIEGIDHYSGPDGDERAVLYTKCVLRDGAGRITGFLGANRDLTDIFALQEQLTAARATSEAAAREVEHLSAAKGGLLSLLSHEFRTPLTAIQGYADMMRDYPLDTETMQEYAGAISGGASRLTGLVNDMLALDRLQAGMEEIDLRPVVLLPVAEEVASLLEPPDATHAIVLDVDPGLPRVMGDPDAIRRILTNLVGNAIKYSPDGGEVFVTAHQDLDGKILIGVRDHGIGIPPEDLDRVFDPYIRLPEGKRRGITGTGLGLSIVRELARAMGGTAWAEPAVGDGALFRVRLPATVG